MWVIVFQVKTQNEDCKFVIGETQALNVTTFSFMKNLRNTVQLCLHFWEVNRILLMHIAYIKVWELDIDFVRKGPMPRIPLCVSITANIKSFRYHSCGPRQGTWAASTGVWSSHSLLHLYITVFDLFLTKDIGQLESIQKFALLSVPNSVTLGSTQGFPVRHHSHRQ